MSVRAGVARQRRCVLHFLPACMLTMVVHAGALRLDTRQQAVCRALPEKQTSRSACTFCTLHLCSCRLTLVPAVQLLAHLSRNLGWTLLRESVGRGFRQLGGRGMNSWLTALPPHLRRRAVCACMPAVEERGQLHIELSGDRMARCMASVLAELKRLNAVSLRLLP